MTKLKPCPFCGGPAEIDTLRGYRNFSSGLMENAIAAYCTACAADISVCYADVPDIQAEQVADMWNKRDTGDLSALVVRLARALREVAPDHDLPEKALDYLQRNGLCGSPLREVKSYGPDNPARLRKPGESLEDYRQEMGWSTKTDR